MESIQFRVEITPTGGNSNGVAPLSLLPITAGDFESLSGPAPGNASVNFGVTPYTVSSNGEGLIVSALGGSGFQMQGTGTIALLKIPIPASATPGQTYSLSVINALPAPAMAPRLKLIC